MLKKLTQRLWFLPKVTNLSAFNSFVAYRALSTTHFLKHAIVLFFFLFMYLFPGLLLKGHIFSSSNALKVSRTGMGTNVC